MSAGGRGAAPSSEACWLSTMGAGGATVSVGAAAPSSTMTAHGISQSNGRLRRHDLNASAGRAGNGIGATGSMVATCVNHGRRRRTAIQTDSRASACRTWRTCRPDRRRPERANPRGDDDAGLGRVEVTDAVLAGPVGPVRTGSVVEVMTAAVLPSPEVSVRKSIEGTA